MDRMVQVHELTTLTFFIKQTENVDYMSEKFKECKQQLFVYLEQWKEDGGFKHGEFTIVFDKDLIIVSLSKNEISDDLIACIEIIKQFFKLSHAHLVFETAFKFDSYISLNSFFRKLQPVQRILVGDNSENSYFRVNEMLDCGDYRFLLTLTEDVLIRSEDGVEEEEEEALKISLTCRPINQYFNFNEALKLTFRELDQLTNKIEGLSNV